MTDVLPRVCALVVWWAGLSLVVAAESAAPPSGPSLTRGAVTATFSHDGRLESLTANGRRIALGAGTDVDGCAPAGPVVTNVAGPDRIQFSRPLRHTTTGREVTVTDTFTPTSNSLRWEVEITSPGQPWSTPIRSRVTYPVNPATRFWTAWSDPTHTNTGWNDPLVLIPPADTRWFYSNLGQVTPELGNFISVPLATFAEPGEDRGLSVVLSPDDTMLDVHLVTTAAGGLEFIRHFHRLGGASPVRATIDLVPHEADWRGGLRWMTERYPRYFDPPLPAADDMAGCGAYSGDERPVDLERLRRMAFRINWKLSDDFPWMGMFLPPLNDPDATWTRACDEPRPPGKPDTTSFRRMNDYARYLRTNGFFLLSYFNVTELGRNMKERPLTEADRERPDLWKDPFAFTRLRLPDAHLRPWVRTFYSAWVSDCGDPVYQEFLLEQAQRHLERLPDAAGICIDRMDWLRRYNTNASDGVSWFNDHAARSLCESWKGWMARVGPLMHNAGKVIFANPMTARVDLMREVDGFYTEHGETGPGLNAMAFLALRKPAITWTGMQMKEPPYAFSPDVDAFFQRHLHTGVFPTAPYPGNNHCIGPDPRTDPAFLDYGPLLDLMRGKKWVLAPHAAASPTPGVKVNLFQVPGGWTLPVTFGAGHDTAEVILRHLPGTALPTATATHPGRAGNQVVNVKREGDVLRLTVPLHRGCAMVRLTPARP